jgi:transcription antitermination factor NusG
MKALAFIYWRRIGILVPQSSFVKGTCGKPHPSEDSEALSKIFSCEACQSGNQSRNSATVTQLSKKWCAVYTNSRHEKRVAQHLHQRQIEHFLPVFHSQRKWSDGSKVSLELPLFPGYIFVHINGTERVRVLEVPGALNVLGGAGRELASLPDAEIDALRSGAHLRNAEPHSLLTVGQRARIRKGALAGMEGFVVRKSNGLRLVLTMDLIMQSISVEVGGEDLEPLAS